MSRIFIFICVFTVAFIDAPKAAGTPDTSQADLSIIDNTLRIRMELAGAKVPIKKKKKADYSISEPFVLNTINPGKTRFSPKANDDKIGTAFSSQYKLPKPARVILTIYQNDSLVKKLLEEYQPAGVHPVFWNGLNEYGVKLFGDFECHIIYRFQNNSEKTQKLKFKVIK